MVQNTDEERARLGERLRNAREYLGLSQEEVAKQLGIPRTALTNIERGSRRVDSVELSRFAQLYGKSIGELTGAGNGAETGTLPEDIVHLAREASKLSAVDRQELTMFAQYLKARSRRRSK
jgi:transcriptional regulator with XRE-family HTH domain